MGRETTNNIETLYSDMAEKAEQCLRACRAFNKQKLEPLYFLRVGTGFNQSEEETKYNTYLNQLVEQLNNATNRDIHLLESVREVLSAIRRNLKSSPSAGNKQQRLEKRLRCFDVIRKYINLQLQCQEDGLNEEVIEKRRKAVTREDKHRANSDIMPYQDCVRLFVAF